MHFKTFQTIQKEISRKIWVDEGSEFYNSSFKKWFKDKNIEMYLTHNEGKSVVAKRYIKKLNNKIYKHMIKVSKNVYHDVLNDIVSKYNKTYHTTIKITPIDVKSDSYAEYSVDSNPKDPKFNIGDHVRIPKYKSIFAKGHDS